MNNMGTLKEEMDKLIEAFGNRPKSYNHNKETLQYLAWKYGFKIKNHV